MKSMKVIVATVLLLACSSVSASEKDCGCIKTPTSYDKTQDVKISSNTAAIGDVKLTAGQAFDIAVEGRATAGNALTTVYGVIPQVHDNTKGINELRETKVDKSVFSADQQRQDEHIGAVQNAAQIANEKADAGAVRADGIEQRATVTDDRSIHNAVRLDGVEKVNGQQTSMLDNHETRITNTETNVSDLNQSFNEYQVSAHNDMVNGDAQVLKQSRGYTNEKFAQLKSSVDQNSRDIHENKREARSGIAGVAAMANIPQVVDQEFTLGVGLGHYKDQNALAVGGIWAVSSRLAAKASVGFTSEDTVVGVGVGIGF